jgi:hypothetical protein
VLDWFYDFLLDCTFEVLVGWGDFLFVAIFCVYI